MNFLKKYRYYIAVFVLGFLQFSNTLNHDYAWDDKIVILENPYVKKGISGIPSFLTRGHTDYIYDKYGYRPVVLTSFALEYELFGLNPRIGHFMNVFYFALLCIIIFSFLRRILRSKDLSLALVIAILYISHPLHVEVVANIKSRDEIFQLAFTLLAFLQFDKYYDTSRYKHLLGTVIFFLLGYLSRENGITILGIMPMYVWLLKDGAAIEKLKKLIIIPILIGVAFLILWWSYTGEKGVEITEGLDIFYEHPSINNSFALLNAIGERFSNSLLLYYRYIKNFVYPFDLVYFYGFNQIPMYRGSHPILIISAAAHLLTFIGIWKFRKKVPVICFAILWSYVCLSPFTHIFFIMPDTMSDRYMFGPSLGFCIALVLFFQRLINHVFNISPQKRADRYLYAIITAVIIVFSITTFQRNRVWKNDKTLVSSDIHKLDNCAKAQEQYADHLFQEFQASNDHTLVPEIIRRYERALEISEHAFYARMKLGSNYHLLGDVQKGIDILRESVSLYPNASDAHFYLGNALYGAEKYEEAIPSLTISKDLAPRNEDSYLILGRCYIETEKFGDAVTLATEAITSFPGSVIFLDIRSDGYFGLKEYNKAFDDIKAIIRMQPESEVFYKKLIGRYQQLGRNEEAARVYQTALERGIQFTN